jgi:hypothetical protein
MSFKHILFDVEEKVVGGEAALKTARHMFNILKEMNDFQSASTDSGIGKKGAPRYSIWLRYIE